MADVRFPGQHSTTTTVTSSTAVQTNIRFDPSYIKTLPGILKIVQAGASILTFICVLASGYITVPRVAYIAWISMIAFWFTGILLGFYLFHILEKFYKIPWLKMELVFCVLWTLLLFIAAVIAVTIPLNAFAAAGFFGFAATIAYAGDCFLKYAAVRGGGLAQGSRVVSKQTASTVESPPPRVGY